jgi:hypothetical protein
MSVDPEPLGEWVKRRTGVLEKEHSVQFRNANFFYMAAQKRHFFKAKKAV